METLTIPEIGKTINAKDLEKYFYWSSFSPDRLATREVESLAKRLDSLREAWESHNQEQSELVRAVSKHLDLSRLYWAREGRCASAAVAGPANFPVERNRKARAAAEKGLEALYHHVKRCGEVWKRKAHPYGEDGDAIRANDPDAVDKLKVKLAAARAGMDANKGYVKNKYRAEVKRIEGRIIAIEKMKEMGTWRHDFDGFHVILDSEDMRLKFMFEEKPDYKTREIMKKHGFRFAPSTNAWQRQLTNNAACTAREVIKIISPEGYEKIITTKQQAS